MAYTVCNTRESSLEVSGASDSKGRSRVNYSITQGFRVDYTGVANNAVTEVDVSLLTELPTVNYTTWYNSNTGLSMPWAVCTSKSITRDPVRPLTFHVDATYETGELEDEQTAGSPPAALTDITPIVTPTVGSYERVLYTDKDNKQCWKLPGTWTPYATPVTETIPTFSLVIEQFESSITYDQMMERSFKLNQAKYRGKAAGLWMIGAVKAREQAVQLASGSVTAVRVTYPLMLSERYFIPPSSDTKVVYGHDAIQPLVDTMKVDDEGNVVPIERNGQVTQGYINDDGTLRDAAEGQNGDRPDYRRHPRHDKINFNTFLQV